MECSKRRVTFGVETTGTTKPRGGEKKVSKKEGLLLGGWHSTWKQGKRGKDLIQVIITESSPAEPGSSRTANDGYEEELNKLSVKELREKIK